jgi:hypothetical protein
VQPLAIKILENTQGIEQTIQFDPPSEIPFGCDQIPLEATSSSGLPVSFSVLSGPAIIEGSVLRILEIPPRSRFPVAVRIMAWQWGTPENPAIKTAEPVIRTVNITRF